MSNPIETTNNFPDPARSLPGCRTWSFEKTQCRLDLLKSEDALEIYLESDEVIWKRKLKRKRGIIQCNLQELAILRWAMEDTKSTMSDNIEYVPQKRYPCLAPHPPDGVHDILEMVPDMSDTELRGLGEQTIRQSLVVLCPAPASACTSDSHFRVNEELYKLAERWPIRQVASAQAVAEGMIDITPVALCAYDIKSNCCSMIQFYNNKRYHTEVEIRTHMPLSRLAGFHMDKLESYAEWKEGAGIALHPSWHKDILRVDQPAVLQCQYRKASIHPSRLYDASSKRVVSACQNNGQPFNYLALSYCWDEWLNNDVLRDKLMELAVRLSIKYFWVDRWCIDQKDEKDKAKEIPRMREYYAGASGCVVLTGPDVAPFECVPQHSGAILSTFQQILRNSAALKSILHCKWTTRIWTLQEALLSRQLIYTAGDQLIDGDYVSELISYLDTSSEEFDELIDHWISGYGSYRWNARSASIVYPRQFRMRDGRHEIDVLRTVFGGEQQYNELYSSGRGLTMPFEEALTMTAHRFASFEEDYIYGILGITEGGEQLEVQYGIDSHVILERLGRAGMITERQLASHTVETHRGLSWLPGRKPGRGLFQDIELLTAKVNRPRLFWDQLGATVVGVTIQWHDIGQKRWVLNRHGMPCISIAGEISFPDLPGLVARVAATVEWQRNTFSEESLRGTHIMLCKDIDRDTRATVAMRVGGDIVGGSVYRKEGYVLEIYDWVKGNVRRFRGRQWLVGSVVEDADGKAGVCA